MEQHLQAEKLAQDATAAEREGDLDRARALLRDASGLAQAAYEQIPESRAKTRAIVAVNALAFLRRAGEYSQASDLARRYLGQSELPQFAERYLLEVILEGVRRREAAAVGAAISGAYSIALRGDGVKAGGIVPLELVLLKLDQLRGYALRVGEWVSDLPYRRKGPVAAAVSRLVVPTISPATIGSYRFDVHIESAPEQLEAFAASPAVTPDRVGAGFFEVIRTVAEEGPDGLADAVSNEEYREGFLRQVRVLAPSGEGLDEIEVAPPGGGRSVILVPELKRTIQKHLETLRPRAERETTRIGILRAVDLDAGRLILREGSSEQVCRIESGVLDDVVGPLVNHRVKVAGSWHRNAFHVADIDEATSADAAELASVEARSLGF